MIGYVELTSDYDAAMTACATLQAASDIGNTTATEDGIFQAHQHLKLPAEGGNGRSYTNKVIVVLTDGVPNAWAIPSSEISGHMLTEPSSEYYASDYKWLNAALVRTSQFKLDRGKEYLVGMGLGADYDFMDKMARMAGTDNNGKSPAGATDPAQYEQTLTDIFTDIIQSSGSRLVQ